MEASKREIDGDRKNRAMRFRR